VDGEDQGTTGPDPDDDWAVDDPPPGEWPGDGLRGWISPDDRLWRHPSEAGGAEQAGPPTGTPEDDGRSRSTQWVIGGAAMCFVLVLAAVVVVISTTGGTTNQLDASTAPSPASLTLSPTTEAGITQVPPASAVSALVSDIRPSMVEVSGSGPAGSTTRAGLVVAAGGIIVTTIQAVSGARSISVLEADGARRPATLIGVDKPSGLAVVSVADDLPAAAFDTGDPVPGDLAMAMSLDPSPTRGASPQVSVYAGTVASSGQVADVDASTDAFSSTAIEAPLSSRDIGCPLVAGDGEVSGLLEAVTRSDGSVLSVFLPAQLVFGVAEQLVTSARVEHGSLGIRATDATDATGTTTTTTADDQAPAVTQTVGARLVAVDSDGPAALSGLEVGDVITSLDGAPVHSLAELDTRLYADPPDATVSVTFTRDGTSHQVSATLGAGDADASGTSTSP
jgi:serine protease Do